MAQSTHGVHSILSNPRVYWLSQRVFGGAQRQVSFVERHVRPTPGARILDVGCGPGEMLRLMPDVRYVGYDLNPDYVELARKRFGGRGEFRCADVTRTSMDGERFDAVIAHGLLHHLDDEGVDRLLALAGEVLDQDGRMLTLDPTRIEGSSRFARWMLRNDRGRDIRTPERYAELGGRRFQEVEVSVENEVTPPVPTRYPVAILECRRPR